MLTRSCIVSYLSAATLLTTVVFSATAVSASFEFRATYIRIVDGDDFFGAGSDLVIEDATMSGDGSTVIFYGRRSDTNEKNIYLVEADGSNLTGILLPANPDQPTEQIWPSDLAISRDGSRAFFVTPWYQHRIYKIEGGSIVEILDMNDWAEIVASVSRPQIRTTWDGQYVFFQEDRDDIWRIHRNGGTPTLIVDDKTVLRNGGLEGWAVGTFDVSDDGSVVTFTLKGYWDAAHQGIVTIPDLFAKADNQTCGMDQCQLTLDNALDDYPSISGDGSTIGFTDGVKWFSIEPDGSGRTELEPRGFNVGGNTLTSSGDRMFYYDTEARGGRLTRTDGAGGLDLFPAWDVNHIAMAATWDPVISDDGTKVCFRHDLFSLYVGRLNPPAPVSPAPVIHDMDFNPSYMLNSDPSARVTLTSRVSDPQGLSDVVRTATDELIDGILENDTQVLPAYFYSPAHDDGAHPDLTAGDGVFSTEGKPGGGVLLYESVTIRMGAMDANRNVSVADAKLAVSATDPNIFFTASFESGDTSGWSMTVP